MTAEMTEDYNERTTITAWRWGVGSVGMFIGGGSGAADRGAVLYRRGGPQRLQDRCHCHDSDVLAPGDTGCVHDA